MQKPIRNQKQETQPQSDLTKIIDQRPKNNDQMTKSKLEINNNTQAETTEANFILAHKLTPTQIQNLIKTYKEIQLEFQENNKLIPLHKKLEIINWLLKDLDNLYEGVYNYLRIWKTRYHKRLMESPESPVIPKFESMKRSLDKIKEIKKLKEEYPLNPKFKKESEK